MDRAEGEFDASVAAGILGDDNDDDDDGDVAEEVEDEDEEVVMDAGQPIEFDEDDAVMARPAPSPVAPQSPSPRHPDDDADGGYGTDYDSDDFVGRSPVKKPKTDGVRAAGGGRTKGATTTRYEY